MNFKAQPYVSYGDGMPMCPLFFSSNPSSGAFPTTHNLIISTDDIICSPSFLPEDSVWNSVATTTDKHRRVGPVRQPIHIFASVLMERIHCLSRSWPVKSNQNGTITVFCLVQLYFHCLKQYKTNVTYKPLSLNGMKHFNTSSMIQ